MFENLNDYPVDPIMIGADYFAQDPHEDKLNLTVGVYQDEHGHTPILQAVKEAERILVETQVSKSYLALTGDAEGAVRQTSPSISIHLTGMTMRSLRSATR